MNQIYTSVKSVLNGNDSSRPTYTSSETRHYDENGDLEESNVTSTASSYINYSAYGWSNETSNSNAYGYFKNAVTKDSNNNPTASYSIMKRSDINGDPYLYLYGESEETLSGANTVTSYSKVASSRITDGSGHNLSTNGTTLFNASDRDALGWIMTNNGNIYTYYNDNYYYLNNSNGTLSVSVTASTEWAYSSSNHTIYDGNYYLIYRNGWALTQLTATYTFAYNGYYLNATTTAVTADTYATTTWYLEVYNGLQYPFFRSNNTNYYLVYATNTGTNSTLAPSTSRGFYFSGNHLQYEHSYYNTLYAYLRTSDLYWRATNQDAYMQDLTITPYVDTSSLPSNIDLVGGKYTYSNVPTTTTENASFDTNPTYFPLGWDENNPTEISNKNTGYVVSGANYASQPGDIRVSQYGNGYLWNSLNLNATTSNGITKASDATFGDSYDSKLEVLTRTANSNGFVRVSDSHNADNNSVNNTMSAYQKMTVEQLGFQKYATSRNALYNPNLQTNKGILAQDTNVYGLHFMDAQISINHLVTAPYVSIDGTDYPNYQLPEDCIDFNLRKSGFINFFAGSYFSGNTTFFSLHQISRNETTKAITGIKEISEIYENEDPTTKKRTPYVYKYSDNTYSSVGTISNNATPVFNMSWVTSPTMVNYAMYYFEIPVNGGEYALGSVANKNGAYLIYLDIGASKYNVNTMTVEERKTTTTDTSLYPLGIDFTTGTSYSTITGGDTAAVKVPASAKGETITYTMSGSSLAVTGDTGSYVRATHIAEGFAATDGSSPLTTADITSTRVVEEKTTESIYNESGFDDSHNFAIKVDTVTTTYINDVQQGSPVTVEGQQELSEITTYDSTITMGGTTTSLVSFHYYAKMGVNVNVSLVYIPADEGDDLDGTYAISITSNADMTIYIDNVTSSITYAGEDEASRLHKFAATINGATVHTGDTITIRAT